MNKVTIHGEESAKATATAAAPSTEVLDATPIDQEPQWDKMPDEALPVWDTQPGWEPSEEQLEVLEAAEINQGRQTRPFSATNWSEPEDGFSSTFYSKYVSQLWFPDEIPLTNDALVWKEELTPEQRWTYSRASAGLNALDTLQGEEGMPTLHQIVHGHTRKATLQLQGMMEDVHARSYSLMNKTFLSTTEEREVFRWIEQQPQLQFKVRVIRSVMHANDHSRAGIWKKLAISCMLETALFYSGFFYPLYLAGQGKMMSAGEIFNLIILDESVHGVYVSMIAQELWDEMEDHERARCESWYRRIVEQLYRNEIAYTEALYDRVELTGEVKRYVRHNFNNLSDNLGLPRLFQDEEIDPVVKNGLSVRSTTHDFFSAKGNSYAKLNSAELHERDVEDAWSTEALTPYGPR